MAPTVPFPVLFPVLFYDQSIPKPVNARTGPDDLLGEMEKASGLHHVAQAGCVLRRKGVGVDGRGQMQAGKAPGSLEVHSHVY